MKALDRKLWREIWQLKGQAAAIMLVIVCGGAGVSLALLRAWADALRGGDA